MSRLTIEYFNRQNPIPKIPDLDVIGVGIAIGIGIETEGPSSESIPIPNPMPIPRILYQCLAAEGQFRTAVGFGRICILPVGILAHKIFCHRLGF